MKKIISIFMTFVLVSAITPLASAAELMQNGTSTENKDPFESSVQTGTTEGIEPAEEYGVQEGEGSNHADALLKEGAEANAEAYLLTAPAPTSPFATNERLQFQVTVSELTPTFSVPTSGLLNDRWAKSYNWDINWGDGEEGNYTEADSPNTREAEGIVHRYSAAGTYTITLTPHASLDAWLGAFGFYYDYSSFGACNAENKEKVTAVLSPLTPLMMRTASQIADQSLPQPSYEWAYTFLDCKNMVMGKDFTFDPAAWSSLTTVGDHFAESMLSCLSVYVSTEGLFTMNDCFNLPQNITTVGDNFCSTLFASRSNELFTMNEVFNLPQNITKVGDSFAYGMFGSCSGADFTMNEVFNLPPSLTAVGSGFAEDMFSYSDGASFTMNRVFNFPQKITEVGDSFAGGMFSNCSGASFTMNELFNLPQNITSAKDNFAVALCAMCFGRDFAMNDVFTLPQSLKEAGKDFASWAFACTTFENTSTMGKAFNLPQDIMVVSDGFASYLFYSCPGSFTMNEVLTFPQNLTSVGEGFAEALFYGCFGDVFQVNDVFKFPRLSQEDLDKSRVFYATFASINESVIQKRSAVSVINNPSEEGSESPTLYPEDGRMTFNAAFKDQPLIHANWGGEGESSDCMVVFDKNGNDKAFEFATASQAGKQGSAIGMPAVHMMPGNLLKGWYKEPTCQNKWDFDTDVIPAGVTTLTLYAGVISAPLITTTALDNAKVGVDYSNVLTATGTAPFVWAMEAGSLPEGVSLNKETGVLSGSPRKAGTFTFLVSATNSAGKNEKEFSLTVDEADPLGPFAYEVMEDFGTWRGEGTRTARIDAPSSRFVELRLGETTVDASCYKVVAGSTEITLLQSYLETRANGTYAYTAVYTDGMATPIQLVVAVPGNEEEQSENKEGAADNPPRALVSTADDFNGALPLVVGMVLGGSTLVFARARSNRLRKAQ